MSAQFEVSITLQVEPALPWSHRPCGVPCKGLSANRCVKSVMSDQVTLAMDLGALKSQSSILRKLCFLFLQKLYIFLFQDILVLTRPVTRNERHSYQVYRQPIPVRELVLEDLPDGDVRMGGSFRGAFSNSDKGESTSFKAVYVDIAQNLSEFHFSLRVLSLHEELKMTWVPWSHACCSHWAVRRCTALTAAAVSDKSRVGFVSGLYLIEVRVV